MSIGLRGSTSSSSKLRTRYHSAIGTHRLRAKPLNSILYPYYRQYKSLYRSINTRTPSYFWPDVDKYPWHSHQKRFHSPEAIRMTIFSEYLRRKRIQITLMELLHTLPLHGINSLCWKKNKRANPAYNHPEQYPTTESTRVLKVNGFDYMVDADAQNDQYFHVRSVNHTIRPFRARVKGDLYIGENLVKQDISPVGSVRGVWKHAYPLYEGTNTIPNDDFGMGQLTEGVSNLQIYRPNVEGPFKNMVQGTPSFCT
ncbi:hypothetical protein MACJ_001040 [Theileria orientalis]|uniref:Uncharacterized protein n=1 Tax=Theileria orientalis TaxID=68886 RepID=A0A976M7W3_THEOR|nr:hypothetical protein MACJ_001040 [Theileria orientalis]